MREQIKIKVTVDIDYIEGQREAAINAALDSVLASAITGSNYNIEPIDSEMMYSMLLPEKSVADCKFYDLAQGRHKCTFLGFHPKTCRGICQNFKEK